MLFSEHLSSDAVEFAFEERSGLDNLIQRKECARKVFSGIRNTNSVHELVRLRVQFAEQTNNKGRVPSHSHQPTSHILGFPSPSAASEPWCTRVLGAKPNASSSWMPCTACQHKFGLAERGVDQPFLQR